MSHQQVPDRDPLRSLDQMRRALEHEFHPLTPTEGALVLQMAATMIRLETLIPRALLSNDPKMLREQERHRHADQRDPVDHQTLLKHFPHHAHLLNRAVVPICREEPALAPPDLLGRRRFRLLPRPPAFC